MPDQNQEKLNRIRHSAAHVLAAAAKELFPTAKLGIGPTIENGFYYDFDLPRPLTETDFKLLTEKMEKFIAKKIAFEKLAFPIAEAKKIFAGQPYKLELIEDFEKAGEKEVSVYKSGDFVDLCKGPHVNSSQEIGAFKLTHQAGAYWRGSEKNKMLTRLYGTAFATPQELDQYLQLIEEAKKRDHKKIGLELELFMFHETAPGMPYWLPKGVILYNELVNFWREEHQRRGYQEIVSPLLNKIGLYKISGHWEHYKHSMFNLPIWEDDEIEKVKERKGKDASLSLPVNYSLKPMNCPNAMIVYGFKTRSYRDLPLRLSDTDTLHRREPSGTLNGLLRVRAFRQDDAHIFVTGDQIKGEFKEILEITELFYSIFKINYRLRLGTQPKDFMGDPKIWERAEKELEDIMKGDKRDYFIGDGEGAFYGPKIDIMMKDALGREWQTGTIQLDFQIPQRFNLKYSTTKGMQETPVVIHRVIYGSLERFIGILIEHLAGAFPVWLSPVQAVIIPISDKYLPYAQGVVDTLKRSHLSEGGTLRIELDDRNETMTARIRDAELQKIPYMLVVGEREAASHSVNVRRRGGKKAATMTIAAFGQLITDKVQKRALDL